MLTNENWSAATRVNYVNKCTDCIRTEKREYQREWVRKNPDKSAKRSREHKLRLAENDPVKLRAFGAYGDSRKRAIKYGMDFDLTSEFVLDMMRKTVSCPYFGWPLTHYGKSKTLASIDRIDSSRGYTQDNVRVISYLANLMKSEATKDELIAFASGVIRMSKAA